LISIIGLGYVGFTQLVGFALKGYDVVGIEKEQRVVSSIRDGRCTICDESLTKAFGTVQVRATSNCEEALDTDVTFICVGTPSRVDGAIDLTQIEDAVGQLGRLLRRKQSYHLVVIRSTVQPGTTENVVIPLLERSSGRSVGDQIGVCVVPEFLREGSLLEDFLNPDRIIVGENDTNAGDMVCGFCSDFKCPIVRTSYRTAEMIKYAGNAFLAKKISFINEIGNICKRLGVDAYDVARSIGFDSRIGAKYLEAGIGFGGSCLPKDMRALIAQAADLGYDATLLRSVVEVNRSQPLRLVEILESRVGTLEGKRVAVLGLAFKAGTDDVRDSQAIPAIGRLLESGAHVSAYDPQAVANMRRIIGDDLVCYAGSAAEALEGADACLILTDWDEFKEMDEQFGGMKRRVILEGRKVLKDSIQREGICW